VDGLLTLPRQFLEDRPARWIRERPEHVIGIRPRHAQTITIRLWFVKRRIKQFFTAPLPSLFQ
jgi:hypothetical protein